MVLSFKSNEIFSSIALKPHYKIEFEAPVWQLRVGAEGGLLAIENRDAGQLQVSFSVLSADTGRVLTQGLQAPENWWVGLEGVHGQVLLLHGYQDRQTGQHQGIQAYDCGTGDLLWEQELIRFYGIGRDYVVGLESTGEEEPRYVGLSYQQGHVLVNRLSSGEAREEVEASSRELAEQYEVPVRYLLGTDYFTLLQDFLLARRGIHAVKAIDYLETDQYLLVAYYSQLPSGKLSSFLAVFSQAGELVREDQLAEEVDGIGAEAFFIYRQKIFLLQDGKSLVSLVI